MVAVDDGIAGNKYMAALTFPENDLILPNLLVIHTRHVAFLVSK